MRSISWVPAKRNPYVIAAGLRKESAEIPHSFLRLPASPCAMSDTVRGSS